MKTYYVLIGLVFTGMISCHSQETKLSKQKQEGKSKPEEKVFVNRKYDENGNLIEFDSVYTSYYSNMRGDTLYTDSILQNFNTYFNHHFSRIASNDLMKMDSTLPYGFFHDDFFEQRFFNQNEQLHRMMREMDSIKNEYFKYNSEGNEKIKL